VNIRDACQANHPLPGCEERESGEGTQFLDLKDAGDPVENAMAYDQQGADEIAFWISLLLMRRGYPHRYCSEDGGRDLYSPHGGRRVRQLEDVRNLLKAGADKVSINTAAVKDPTLLKSFEAFRKPVHCHCHRCEKERGELEVYTHGGRIQTDIDAVLWAKRMEEVGAGEILLTSMDRDGTKDGYDIELTRTISEQVGIPVIASGGVGKLEHLYEGLVHGKADAVLAASIFHYREYTISQVKSYLKERGVTVRP